jgi:hypothetical protein
MMTTQTNKGENKMNKVFKNKGYTQRNYECTNMERLMSYTPGPWSQFVWDKRKPHLRTIGARNKQDGPDHILTAEISEADARLIAAAPDLLEAAKAVIQRYVPNFNFDFSDAPEMLALEKAIAKAERKAL